MNFKDIDHGFISFANKWYEPLARCAFFVIFFYFGFLKLVGMSPADELARSFVEVMGLGMYFNELFFLLALVECVIGILFLVPKFTRIVILLLFGHMLVVCSPLVFVASVSWSAPLVPSLEGQYIIKNIALVVLALGLVSRTTPLKHKK